MNRCLVTGYKGYIGSKLYTRLQELGCEVLGIDIQDGNSVVSALAEDEGRFQPLYAEFAPEYIFHLACCPKIGTCLEYPVKTMHDNVMSGSVMLNFARKTDSVRRVIYSSSSAVVGNGKGPTNPYALHKLTTEQECGIYANLYNLDVASLRYFNVYSEDQNVDDAHATIVARWRNALLNGVKPCITGSGEQRRDMVHVEDIVAANIHCMQHDKRFDGVIFDVGTGDNISLNQMKDIVQKYHKVEFDYVSNRQGEISSSKANIKPLADCGWRANISIADGLGKCFNFQ